MPRFTNYEKEKIKEKLFIEGEKLFTFTGLRKTTIDDLSDAAGISHSSFYAFYKSKEELFMKIVMKHKLDIYKKMDRLLEEKSNLSPKDLAKFYITSLRVEIFSDPIILSLNNSLVEYISGRVSSDLIPNNELIDQEAIEKLTKTGVNLHYSKKYTVKATQAVFVAITHLDNDEDREIITHILIDALIDKLVV